MNPRFRRRTALKGLAAAAAGPAGLAACANEPPAPPTNLTQADIDEAMSTPTDLTFWTWVPDIQNEVALFEAAYPAIKVEVVNAGQGDAHYQKLRTALRAGNGGPDVAQMEFQMIPTFSITDSLVDLGPYLDAGMGEKFVDWTWSQVTGTGGEIWAIPQDTGPLGMLYRADLFEQHGIDVPGTWDEFAEAAAAIHEADPDLYLTNLPPNQGAFFSGLLWQAGADPFAGTADEVLQVDLQSDTAKRVASYWGDLAQRDLVSTDPDFTDQWYQSFNQDRYATWLTAAWGPVFLSGAAESTSGKWRAAPLPQWDSDADPVSGNWGGSTSAVMATTQNPIVAAKFAEWLNTDSESANMMATEQFLYPPTLEILDDPDFTGQELDFYGGQQVNEVFAQITDTVTEDFQWSPFQSQVYAYYNETVGTSFTEKGDAVAALAEWESRIETYADYQGFTVK
ncbi:ABC transporter substrate-binding protein [Glycomyces salinus]|uniref:ABC transporter substrate-binding protein n=1 Tax=Glycomyces salinus TaxID=980294 RepID=UPI0018ECB8AE|nr:extracellular solute-binding protein [Glycomyces salinus]